MSRKLCCLFLALSVFVSTISIAYADQSAQVRFTEDDYRQAEDALREEGIVPVFEDARQVTQMLLSESLLSNTADLSLLQLRDLARDKQKAAQQAQQAAREQLADNLALLAAYKGVKFNSDAQVYSDAGTTASSEVIPSGKVAQYQAVDASGKWYLIAFDDFTGYVSADSCTPASYDEYKDTDAVLSEEEVARRKAEAEAAASSVSITASGSAVISGGSSLRSSIADYAYSFLGIPYYYGGASRSGTDCSGLTMQIFASFGVSLYHGATSQYAQSTPISRSDLQAGDLVFFHCGYSGIGHVGIYVGGGSFIHASNSGVQVDSLYSSYWDSNYCCAGRIVTD